MAVPLVSVGIAASAVMGVRQFGMTVTGDESSVSEVPHRSNAEKLIAKSPVIEVETDSVLCDGGGGSLGHPIVNIRCDTPTPQICIWCGLRYIKKKKDH